LATAFPVVVLLSVDLAVASSGLSLEADVVFTADTWLFVVPAFTGLELAPGLPAGDEQAVTSKPARNMIDANVPNNLEII